MQYVSKIALMLRGAEITDFIGFTEHAVEIRKPVELMNKTGFIGTTPRRKLTVEYVVPFTGEINWVTVEDAQLVVIYDSGKTSTFTGVSVLSVGEKKSDGQNASTVSVELMAENKIEI